jgi:hypothetical protein
MKTKRAASAYTCFGCKGQIDKGQRYAPKRITIGTRGDESVEKINGYPYIVQNWASFDVRYCQACAEAEVLNGAH